MLAVKDIVYKQHRVMLRLYEQYCKEAGQVPYWDNDEDDLDEGGAAAMASADPTNEHVADDGF